MTIVQWFMAAALLLPFGVASAATSNSMNVPITITAPSGPGNEEFVGPFANWLNVKTTAGCGAKGDGSTDDTTAIQNCINKLSNTTPVLYFPAGTYKITSALTLTSGNFVSLIGADPSTTTISWGGPANSVVMLKVQGTHYSRVDRLTFNANHNVGILIQQSQDNGAYFDTANEYADDVFINAGGSYNNGNSVDFACGYTIGVTALISGNGCAETSMLRDHFTNGSMGIEMGNYNAADMWVWYSTFTNKNGWALYEDKGDLHAFHNNFFNSVSGDIRFGPESEHTADWNYSSGSNQFINCPNWNASVVTVVEANTIVNTTLPQAIDCNDQGPTILIDNFISSCTSSDGCASDNGAPAVRYNYSSYPSDLVSTGNQYTVGTANACNSTSDAVYSVSRCHAVGDSIVAHSHPSAPTLPGTPPQYCASGCSNTVSVQEVAGGASAATIQAAINAAAAIGNGAVVHLQGNGIQNSLSAGLTVPGNTFIQIIGDGDNTQLVAPSGTYAFTCGSACKAWFRDLKVYGNGYSAIGIKITGADQSGGRVFMEEAHLSDAHTDLLVNGLSQTNVEIHDTDLANSVSGGDAVNVVGGSGPSASHTNVFAASSNCDNVNFVRTSGNANFTLRHLWYDAGGCNIGGTTIAQVSGTGSFTMAAARTYPIGTPGHYFNITNFSGTSAILGMFPIFGSNPADVYISGSAAGNNLVVGYIGCYSPGFTDTATNDVYYVLDPQTIAPATCGSGTTQTTAVTETSHNVSNPLSFLNTTLAPLRAALPTVPGASGDPALASGVTDARIYRVSATQCSYGIDVEP